MMQPNDEPHTALTDTPRSPGSVVYKIKWSANQENEDVETPSAKTVETVQQEPLIHWNSENAREYSTKSLVLGSIIAANLFVIWLLEIFLTAANIWYLNNMPQRQPEDLFGPAPGIVAAVAQFLVLPLMAITTVVGALHVVSYLRANIQFRLGIAFTILSTITFGAQMAVSISGILIWAVNDWPRISFIMSLPLGIPLFTALISFSVARLFSLKNDLQRIHEQDVTAKNLELQ
jgi:hypothetical protein